MYFDFSELFDQEFQETVSSMSAGVLSILFTSVCFVPRIVLTHVVKSLSIYWVNEMVSLLATGGIQPESGATHSVPLLQSGYHTGKGLEWFLPTLTICAHPRRKLF